MNPIDQVLSRLNGVKPAGAGWSARCPAHEDSAPSLSISQGNDGRVLLCCHAGCSTGAVVAALGLTLAELFSDDDRSTSTTPKLKPFANPNATPKRRNFWTADEAIASLPRSLGEAVQRWEYVDSSGTTVGWVLRSDLADGQKEFRPISLVNERWVVGAMPEPRPPYRLPHVQQADNVYICEGEKAADAIASLGLCSTTSAGGAHAPGRTDWSALRGKFCVILPDNDAAGQKYAETVATVLSNLEPRPQIRIVSLPGLPEHGDAVEFLNARDSQTAEELRAEIETLVAGTPPFVGFVSSLQVNSENSWPDPQPLPSELPPVKKFDLELLPVSVRPYVADISERIQCPPDYPAVSLMIVLATLVGRKLGIRPKQQDDWLVIPNLYGAVIGPPGVMKTPAIQEPLRALKRIEIEAKREFEAKQAEHEAADIVAKQRRKLGEAKVKAALESGDGNAIELARESLANDVAPAKRTRFCTNDSTVEKLGELLAENPNGLLVFRDELNGLLKSLEKEGQEGARAFYLEAWNGNGRFTYDRIARGTIDIEAAIISILGSIQPGPLRTYLVDIIEGGESADGLLQRFQLAVYPDVSPDWRNVDRWPDSEARRAFNDLVDRLRAADGASLGGTTDEQDPDGVPFVRFGPAAQALFDEWRQGLEIRVRQGTEHPVVIEHLSKFRSLIPSLALLIHIADDLTGQVGTASLEKAIAWGEYLETHAKRIYALAIYPGVAEATALSKKLLSGELKGEFALRDVYRKGWTGLSTRPAALRAVEYLTDLDWLAVESQPTPGRTKNRYLVNPKILERPKERTDKTDRSAA